MFLFNINKINDLHAFLGKTRITKGALGYLGFALFFSYSAVPSDLFPQKQKPQAIQLGVSSRTGGDLLSHWEAQHYHRHDDVSLLSSGWDQVGPSHYGRRNIPLITFYHLFILLQN